MGAIGGVGDRVRAVQKGQVSVAPVVPRDSVVLRQCDLCGDRRAAGLIVVEANLDALPVTNVVAELANVELAGPRRHHCRRRCLRLHAELVR